MGELETPADKEGDGGVQPKTEAGMSRKEKRKTMKKMKRKQTRKEIALKQHEEEEARLQDPQELINMEQEEAKRSESVRIIFEERERAWIEAMEIRKKKRIEEEEERRISALEYEELSRKQQIKNANDDGDDDWEYVEEGPAEIIWQENEITVKKKRVKVPKRNKDQRSIKEDSDRPTSNPLPPQSEAFDDYKNASLSAQQLIETVAAQVPHFGTEQDKDHCPFHLKTGACRFGQHCSRVHFYPDKSSTLLIKNMYNGPGLTWEQDEGLEYIDEEIERCYEDFYEDVHTEFLKFGEIINFKVCINGAPHLRGNVYVQYSALESALVAHQSVNGRYFAGKQISCDFINVTRWKVAICGEYVKSRYKTCSRGRTCNFIHCFRNPGGEYEWADSDRPPPKYWVEKMVALFGYSDAYKKHMMEDNSGQLRNSSKKSMTDSQRYVVQRSSSRDGSYSSFAGSSRRYDNENYAPKGTGHHRPSGEENAYLKDFHHRKNRKYYIERVSR
ncbi:zinc finger CCCH domain-containing protein 5-like [Rosa rugosa]|uniref:zinc finger CCCH domain-containing protein 5-like n=1 Tax=Rosa rugosa TaxID=74645 RepID=UPI002B402C4D|nr:zinc finger CCCH domain-containing protein 5-like [Rosa rugosa]